MGLRSYTIEEVEKIRVEGKEQIKAELEAERGCKVSDEEVEKERVRRTGEVFEKHMVNGVLVLPIRKLQ